MKLVWGEIISWTWSVNYQKVYMKTMSSYIFVLYTEKSDFFHGAVVLAVYVPLWLRWCSSWLYIYEYIYSFSLLPKVYTSYEGEVNPRLWHVLTEGLWVAWLSQNFNEVVEVCGECKGMAPRVFCFSSDTLHLGVPVPSFPTRLRAGKAVGSPAVDLPQHRCWSGSFIVHWLLKKWH